MAEQKGSGYFQNAFKFNGKELDDETGLYYYGARYYDPKTSIWLSVDPEFERAPGWNPYAYCFQNPVAYTDPDGRWPWPTWGSIKSSIKSAIQYDKMKSDWKNIKNTVYNGKGWDDTVKDVKRTGRDIQKWTKDNKQQLLGVAKGIQKVGDDTTTAGLASAAVGAAITAPVGGEGAAPGLAVAGLGSAVSGAGSVLEIGVELITGDEEAMQDIGGFIGGKAVEATANKFLPGAGPQASQEFKAAVKVTREIIKTETSKKTEEIIKEKSK